LFVNVISGFIRGFGQKLHHMTALYWNDFRESKRRTFAFIEMMYAGRANAEGVGTEQEHIEQEHGNKLVFFKSVLYNG